MSEQTQSSAARRAGLQRYSASGFDVLAKFVEQSRITIGHSPSLSDRRVSIHFSGRLAGFAHKGPFAHKVDWELPGRTGTGRAKLVKGGEPIRGYAVTLVDKAAIVPVLAKHHGLMPTDKHEHNHALVQIDWSQFVAMSDKQKAIEVEAKRVEQKEGTDAS
jgi:hypothetical protein